MKKILMVGAGIEQVPAIQLAKQMGIFVVATDMNVDAPGMKLADKVFHASTTCYEQNLEIAKQENVDGVLTIGSETAVMTVAKVANKLNLTSFSEKTAKLATNKFEMRKALCENGVAVSDYIVTDNINEANAFLNETEGLWVVKPIDSSGQRGTNVISAKDDLPHAFQQAKENSISKQVLIDQFVEGPEVHVTMNIVDGKVHFLALSDRITLNKDYFGIAVRHFGPSKFSDEINERIKLECEKSVKAISLKNGVATCELILQDEHPVIMEIAIRTPGGYLRDVAMHLSGVDIFKTTIWTALGLNKTFQETITEEKHAFVSVLFISGLNVHPSIKKITSVQNIDKVLAYNDVKKCQFHFDQEYHIKDLDSSVGRFGVIIAVGNDENEVLAKTEKCFNKLKINNESLIDYKDYNRFNRIFN